VIEALVLTGFLGTAEVHASGQAPKAETLLHEFVHPFCKRRHHSPGPFKMARPILRLR
jgi:hypothetical protein